MYTFLAHIMTFGETLFCRFLFVRTIIPLYEVEAADKSKTGQVESNSVDVYTALRT